MTHRARHRVPFLLALAALADCHGNQAGVVVAPAGDAGGGTVGRDGAARDQAGECPVSLRQIEFTNEEPVTILGYDLDAMEVDVTYDGQVLMWNDEESNGPEDKNLHWASRVDDTTYQYEGEVDGLNSVGVDGTPSFGRDGALYYTSTVDYATNGFKSFYRAYENPQGRYEPVLLEGLYGGRGFVSVDPDISSNGRYLYYSLFTIRRGGGIPRQIELMGAVADGSGGFQRLDDGHLENLNTEHLDYAPTISNDGLELYFTRANPATATILGIYRSVRASTSVPFPATDTPVSAISGVVEAPAFNGDETALYYHRKESPTAGVYRVYRVTRSLPPECR